VLPGDPTCAGIARRLFRRVASELSLDGETSDDGVTMVSELAANTLHANQHQLLPANSELWLYLRGTGQRTELVCKVFDTLPGWMHGNVPGRTACRAPADAMSGRGLEVVHELSDGHWGHHLTRSRLSGTGIRGKAVWFALPVPASVKAGGRPPATASDAMTELEKDLSTRGFGGRLVRADDHAADMAVLSIASGLTVWCRAAAAWLRAPGTPAKHWSYCDLVEVGEQAVQAHETNIATADSFQLADVSKTGSLAGSRGAGQRGERPVPRSAPALSTARPGAAGRRRAPSPRSGRRRSRWRPARYARPARRSRSPSSPR